MLKNKQPGFTIVELLIVIVIIGILATITIVAYNGIQVRARFAKSQSDINNTQQLVEIYHAQYGTYPPVVTDWGRQTSSNQNTYIPNLVPEFTSTLPIVTDGTGQYLYRTNGTATEYKIIKYRSTSTTFVNEWNLVPDSMKDASAIANKDRYGVWSSGGYNL